MTTSNIRAFSEYSRCEIARLSHLVEASSLKAGRYAFAGNMANINYTRAAPLRRRGMDVDLILHPSDDFIFAQPGWEDFDGSISELGTAPTKSLMERGVPFWVCRHSLDANWSQNISRYKVARPDRILMWAEYMPYLPTLEALSKYDALLVSQFPFLGLLSNRPYLFGPNGGDIWFEAARDDQLGINARRGIENAYAVLISNPITFAHARRYGLRNLLYVPMTLDEEIYQPGDAEGTRLEWQRELGGDFFVLTSMRIDKQWKGAHHALDGFAKFVAKVPSARLVVLGWGEDIEGAKATLEARNLTDRVLVLPIVGKRRLLKYLQAVDVVVEQFVLGYYGASGLEAMACGKPVIMRLERNQYNALIPAGAPPTLDADDFHGVEEQLSRLFRNRQFAKNLGKRTREWFLEAQSSLRWSKIYDVLLRAMAIGIPLSTVGSPLLTSLSNAEIEYHSDQLRQAPEFPYYTGPPINHGIHGG